MSKAYLAYTRPCKLEAHNYDWPVNSPNVALVGPLNSGNWDRPTYYSPLK